jgi:methyl-accepting chemotaxis protein
VQQQAGSMKESLNDLGKQAEGIGQIMNVITDIADQTNLLALNAAIEAARAGDAGRGFAVVADEVRKLAEKTMSATKEVGAVVSSIQEGTRSNIRDMDKTYAAVGESATLVNEAGGTLREIVRIVETTSDQVRGIATASEEQSAASEEINRGTEEISRISSETSEAMNQSARAVSEMAELSQELQRLIDELRQA